jgi:hypothetical protein
MTDHWQVIEDELQRSRDALAFACLSHNFTPPAIKVRCDKMDAALAFVREQRQLAAHPDNVCRCSCAPCSYCDCKLEAA